MRVVALIATYNEARGIAACLRHLRAQGIDFYVIDNESTDDTLAIVRRFAGHGLCGWDTLPRAGCFDLRAQLARKEALAARLDADWFMHMDADEFRLSPHGHARLCEALAWVDRCGYNAVNFQEYTFVPTREAPDHDHPDFLRTMRHYYAHTPHAVFQLKAWKRTEAAVRLQASAGHRVEFAGLRRAPVSFPMRHYQVLSREHIRRKYEQRRYSTQGAEALWHCWRRDIRADDVVFPAAATLQRYRGDALLTTNGARRVHLLAQPVAERPTQRVA